MGKQFGEREEDPNQIRVAQKAKVISAMCHYKIQIHSTQYKYNTENRKEKRVSNQIRITQKAKRYLPCVITNANTYKYKYKVKLK